MGRYGHKGSCRKMKFEEILDGACDTSKMLFTYTHFSLKEGELLALRTNFMTEILDGFF